MLHNKQCSAEGWTFEVDGVQTYFSRANEGTKVSIPSCTSWSHTITVRRLWLLPLWRLFQSGEHLF